MRMIILGLSAAALLAGCNNSGGGNIAGPVNMAGPQAPGNMAGPGAPAGPGFPGFGPAAPGGPTGPGVPAGPGGAPGPGYGPGGPAPGGGAGAGGDRVQAEIAQCVQAASAGGAPPGFNIQQYCNCAVNSAMSGTPPNEAVRQCAAQQGIQMPGQ